MLGLAYRLLTCALALTPRHLWQDVRVSGGSRMGKFKYGAALVLALTVVAFAGPALAQQTAGNITGRVLDEQGAAIPGATVTAKNPQTGFTRSDVSDAEGTYRLTSLPVAVYEVTTELQGFTSMTKKDIEVTVAQTLTIDFALKIASLAETVTVSGATPLVETSQSSVGGVVDVRRIESLPLNGRQFANLAATIPGVGLGFHSDPTKSSQFSPQIGGGNGRNVNYLIDGGDNNDDTVGGLLQLFPLEAIQEFNFQTARYKAEYGRSNGGVMNIVTKSGTNQYSGSFFSLFRDTAMNARTETEKLQKIDKQPYDRQQFGGSLGGPIATDKAHFFFAAERTQADPTQTVTTLGLFPELEGTFATPYRENLVTAKAAMNVNAAQYLTVRYGRNSNSQPYGTSSRTPPEGWGTSTNAFNSINVNHNWVLGGSKLNEFIFQYADFQNHINANSTKPNQTFPNSVSVGQSVNTPQSTNQEKYQFRDDFSWHMAGMGLGHDLKTGVNFINEPRLFVTFNTLVGNYSYTHNDNDPNGPLRAVSLTGGEASGNIPTKQFSTFFQDDWRVNDRLTLNLGIRYDLNTGFAIDQSKNRNFVILQTAGQQGLLKGEPGFEDFGLEPREDYNNVQPRLGFAYDVRGNGHDVLRGGYGHYYDFGYTNANILFAQLNAINGISTGAIYSVTNSNGIRNIDGSFYRVGQPTSLINQPNEAPGLPLNSHIASPRIKQPWSEQVSFGWSHQLNDSTVVDVDYVHIKGRDLGWRPALNQRDPGVGPAGPRHFAALNISPANFTIDISNGRSSYNGANFSVRRRMTKGIQFSAWYSLSEALGTTGNGSDELSTTNIQNHRDPFGDVQFGPAGRTDARHRMNLSSIIQIKGGFQVSPIFRFRSALPVTTTEGLDLNQNGVTNDIPLKAYQFVRVDKDSAGNPVAVFKEIGDCKTINCSRGAKFSQFDVRLSKAFNIGRTRIEGIAEVFNLFNATNPAAFTTSRMTGSIANPSPNAAFMLPTAYAGDFQRSEQRIGQLGFRIAF
jgi:hypothetical protein